MGSVALLTREGEVKIAKEIEEGEKEIVLSCLKSKHALEEIVKLKEKILSAENESEYVKDLVRGLDDESSEKDKPDFLALARLLSRFAIVLLHTS